MSSQSKRNSPPPAERMAMLEKSRQGLAKERNQAIEQVNRLKRQMLDVFEQHQQMRNDMVRWVTAFMLLREEHEVTFSEDFLQKTDEWVVTRENDAEKRTISWALITREEAKARQEVAKATAEAERVNAEVLARLPAEPKPE